MKRISIIFALLLASTAICSAQASTTITISSSADTIVVDNDTINSSDIKDVGDIRIGSMTIIVSNKDDHYKNSFHTVNEDGTTVIDITSRYKEPKYNGHWAALQVGVNGYAGDDYSMYEPSTLPSGVPSDFMDLKQAASWEVNLNFLEFNFGLNARKNFGITTGMGVSWNNYKFDNSISIDKGEDGIIHPFDIEEQNYKKSKLLVTYLTVPLLLEYQFKSDNHKNGLFVNAGVVAALNIGSRTKIKNNNSKTKDRGNFNVNPFKGSGIVQFGGGGISVYGMYSFTELFEDNKGPGLTPFSVGINLVNLW